MLHHDRDHSLSLSLHHCGHCSHHWLPIPPKPPTSFCSLPQSLWSLYHLSFPHLSSFPNLFSIFASCSSCPPPLPPFSSYFHQLPPLILSLPQVQALGSPQLVFESFPTPPFCLTNPQFYLASLQSSLPKFSFFLNLLCFSHPDPLPYICSFIVQWKVPNFSSPQDPWSLVIYQWAIWF